MPETETTIEFASNVIVADLTRIKGRIGMDINIDTFDNALKAIANQVSSSIENALIVNEHGVLYRGIFKQRTITNESFVAPSNSRICFAPFYPVISISAMSHSANYTDWTDYSGPFIPRKPYQIFVPNDMLRADSRLTGVFGFAEVPAEIEKIYFEMIQLTVNESGIKSGTNAIGKNLLAVKSEGIASQAASSTSFEKQELNDRQIKTIKKYIRPSYAQSVGITR